MYEQRVEQVEKGRKVIMKDIYLNCEIIPDNMTGKCYDIKNTTLTVMGFVGKDSTNKVYAVSCIRCSEDSELYPEGTICCTKGVLERGGLPCGCAKNPRWSYNQYTTLAKRKCVDLGLIFHSQSEVDNTILVVDNKGTLKSFGTSTFLTSGRVCKNIVLDKGLVFNEDKNTHTRVLTTPAEFVSKGDYLYKGLLEKFNLAKKDQAWRLLWADHTPKKSPYYLYHFTCSNCNEDKLYNDVLKFCPIYTTSLGTLKLGSSTCNCDKPIKLEKEDFIIYARHTLRSEGSEFIKVKYEDREGFLSGNIHWRCGGCGANREQKITDFWAGCRCSCGNTNNMGLYINRLEEDDFLYLMRIGSTHIKIGRSFNVHKRVRELKHAFSDDVKLIQCYSAKHHIIYKMEANIKVRIREIGMYYNKTSDGWSETCPVGYLNEIEELFNDQINNM